MSECNDNAVETHQLLPTMLIPLASAARYNFAAFLRFFLQPTPLA